MHTHQFIGLHRILGFISHRALKGERIFFCADSRDICRYVCNQFPNDGNKTLYASGALERASIEQWLQAEAQNFGPPSSALVFQLAFVPHLSHLGVRQDHAVIAENEDKLKQILDV